MTRPMQPAPPGVTLAKTSRHSWVALTEEWSASGALLALHPLREPVGESHGEPAPILQKRQRAQILASMVRALHWARPSSPTESEGERHE